MLHKLPELEISRNLRSCEHVRLDKALLAGHSDLHDIGPLS